MELQKSTSINLLFTLAVFSLFLFAMPEKVQAQDPDCEFATENGIGYTSIIKEVIDNGFDSYSITLSLYFDGCPGPGCKNVSYIALEAAAGTYSNVTATAYVGGDVFTPSINLGPNQGGIPFEGMKISGLGDFGKVNGAEVVITYTLAGGLQTQQTLVKAGSKEQFATLNASDFQSVLDCNGTNIYPYYPPPAGGKVNEFDCPILGPELCSFYGTYLNLGVVVTDDIFQTDGTLVLITVKAEDNQITQLSTTLTSPGYGMVNELIDLDEYTVTGWYPIDNLWLITGLTGVAHEAHPGFTPLTASGLVTSQGDAAMRADISRNVFGLGGAGVKIGVLSDSYNTKPGNQANDDVVKGDLPGIGYDAGGNPVPNPLNDTDVDVLLDYAATASDEGRAMLQIIHDVAPQADLAFRTAFRSDIDFALGILELRDAGCDIIVDDVTYIEEPFFRDGVIAQAVESVVADGVTYFSAAGNYGTSGYISQFNSVPAPPGLSGQAHNFAGSAGTDVYQHVSVPEGNYTMVLQWDDGAPYGDAVSDLDIYLAKDDGSPLFGFNRDNTDGRQLEVLPFTVGAGGAETNIIVINASGTPNVTFQYIVFRGLMTQNEWANTIAPTLVGQANAENAIAVGAVLYENTPEYGVNPPTPASFSSRGGTPVNGVYRDKPNVMGPNGVNTTIDLGSVDYELDGFPNFFGTSAAAPHVAAVGALLSEATTKYYGTQLSPASMKAILQSTAVDMDIAGYDVATGYGYTQADAALITLANPTPLVFDLVYDTTLIPGIDTIEITITGEYFTDGSTIYFNGEPVGGDQVIVGDSTITATILPFGPELFTEPFGVFNPAQPQTNGTDGGLSGPIYLTQKETVLINIADKTKKYGEVLPDFTVESIDVVDTEGNSVSLEASGLTPDEKARIQAIVLEAPNVSSLTNAGLWAIKASTSDPLNPVSTVEPTDPLDIALLEQYDFVIFDGLLTIEKMDMTIIPQETSVTYGDPLGEFQFDYLYNNDPETSVEITPEDNAAILSAVSTAHATVLVNARATALVNASATALVNYSFLVSATATALVNSSDVFDLIIDDPDALFDATALVNGTATATVLVNGVSRATVLVNATALVNGTATVLVNGTATPLVNGTATVLVNASATALVNSTTINANSNSQAIVILGEEDIDILLGNTSGEIILQSMNLIPSTDVGEHWIVPGTALLPNFNVTYEAGGPLNVLPAVAPVTFDEASLQQVFDATPKSVTATADPAGLAIDYLYDGLPDLPVNAGTYEVTATVNDLNYIGSETTLFTIDPAPLAVSADPQEKTYGEPDPLFTASITSGVLYDGDALTGALVRELGEDVASYSIFQGLLTAGPNYAIEFTNGTMTINPAAITVIADNLDKVYGTADPELTYQLTTGALVGTDGFSGSLSRVAGEDVNTYAIQQGDLTAGTNYTLSFEEGLFTIDPAPITVTADALSKTYGDSDPVFTYQVTTGALVGSDMFTGTLVRDPGEDAATYNILQGDLSAGSNYTLSFVGGTFTILAAPLEITADDKSKTYGDTDPALTYQVTSGSLFGNAVTGSLVRASGEGAGGYAIGQGTLDVGTNFSLTFVEGQFTINPASLIITLDPSVQFIFEGDPLPPFNFAYSGFIPGEDASVLTGLDVLFSPNYNGNAGTFQVYPQASSGNYTISTVPGILYVNPFGPGTKHIIPKLDCVEEMAPGSTYGWVAHYSYQNKNADDVYIPIGEDNHIDALGSFDGSDQPELFLAGGGTFSIPFDGQEMTWTLASYNHKGQKGAQGAGASSTSLSCNKSSFVENENVVSDEINAYPNPTADRVYLNLKGQVVNSDDVSVYDIRGNLCPVDGIRPSGQLMEVDLTGLQNGVYFIRVNMESRMEMIRVIKQ